MGVWDRFGEWLSALLVASLLWLNGALTPVATNSAGNEPIPAATAPALMLAWAQDEDAPPIEQVGEGQTGDVETLDETAAQSEEEPTDVAAQDMAGSADEDVELLDQGAPPTAQQEGQVPVAETAPPADTTYVAPLADAGAVDASVYTAPVATGPALPEGFGTGRVHVATGKAGFPAGLEDCHVGAVTGRAYVGVDCGDGDSFVGHAPSFEEFPFVVDENFPFGDQGAPGAETQEPSSGNDGDVLVAAGGQNSKTAGDETTETVFETSSNTSVQYEQRAKNREARVRVEGKKNGAKGAQKADKEDNEDADSSDNSSDDDSVSAEQKSENSKHKKSKNGKKRHHDKKDRRKSAKDKN